MNEDNVPEHPLLNSPYRIHTYILDNTEEINKSINQLLIDPLVDNHFDVELFIHLSISFIYFFCILLTR